MPAPPLTVLVVARNEADRLPDTLAALRRAVPAARLVVADDASIDATAEVAATGGADVVTSTRRRGKGGTATLAARRLLAEPGFSGAVVLCDGDLGSSAGRLTGLLAPIASGEADLAVAVFTRRVGGGFGLARWLGGRVIERFTGWAPEAPLSGQRALAPGVLGRLLPFAPGFGMEVGMTVDAHRAGLRVVEVALDLEHRATGRTAAGFAHRGRQLVDIVRAGGTRLLRPRATSARRS